MVEFPALLAGDDGCVQLDATYSELLRKGQTLVGHFIELAESNSHGSATSVHVLSSVLLSIDRVGYAGYCTANGQTAREREAESLGDKLQRISPKGRTQIAANIHAHSHWALTPAELYVIRHSEQVPLVVGKGDGAAFDGLDCYR